MGGGRVSKITLSSLTIFLFEEASTILFTRLTKQHRVGETAYRKDKQNRGWLFPGREMGLREDLHFRVTSIKADAEDDSRWWEAYLEP